MFYFFKVIITSAPRNTLRLQCTKLGCYCVPPLNSDLGRKTGNWSGRPDLNRRPLHPQCSALPGCATPRLRIEEVPQEGAHDTECARQFKNKIRLSGQPTTLLTHLLSDRSAVEPAWPLHGHHLRSCAVVPLRW